MSDVAAITDAEPLASKTRAYARFVRELRCALLKAESLDLKPFLDGLASQRCIDLMPLESLRALGAYFTPSDICRRLVDRLSVRNWDEVFAFDPCCGAGDLLLQIAARLPLRPSVSSTLKAWNRRISGCDVSREFVEAARLRLALLAANRGARVDDSPTSLARNLTNLTVADGLAVSEQYAEASCIVMNPPYGRVVVTKRPWREGSLTAAALFVERAARLTRPGAQITALLPEVLRTGSSYQRWRAHLQQLVRIGTAEAIGVFSRQADIDVFIQDFVRLRSQVSAPSIQLHKDSECVGDHFFVNVGAVVPHRHPAVGPKRPYLHARNAKPWGEVRRIRESRGFAGRTFAPPFVVVRRTSRPSDMRRAVATLVLGARPVAVENHLLVLTPKRPSAEVCRALLRLLDSPSTNDFLNAAMRCRHLTTGSLASLPWMSSA